MLPDYFVYFIILSTPITYEAKRQVKGLNDSSFGD